MISKFRLFLLMIALGLGISTTVQAQSTFRFFDAIEYRFFLAANEGHLVRDQSGALRPADTLYSYDLMRPWQSACGRVNTNGEWCIARCDSVFKNNYVLKNLPPFHLDASQADSAHCSFIYRFDSISGSPFGSIPLAQVEYTLVLSDGSQVTYDSVALSWSEYHTDLLNSPNEHPNIRLYPNLTYSPAMSRKSKQQYAIANTTLPNRYRGMQVERIECAVKKLFAIDLYVRGLRIRSDLAEKVLTNDKATIDSVVRWIENEQVQREVGGTGWKPVLRVDEAVPVETFRAVARIDQIWFARCGSHLVTSPLSADHPGWYHAIFEDETGSPLPDSTDACFHFHN